ncbi:uncharacterized protein Dwil_GK11349 [Drosophila willistoni]|uniref:Cystatin domain-containing protein n=1 Tax=Drosophila willistoni TaxID=7260 RepID=B4NAM2_DROWI|nr:cystatin-like protein [Drosophila willistoni]EDW80836.1 uncharacterized protein Dwil_GK11349 [Drosophila willistoni]
MSEDGDICGGISQLVGQEREEAIQFLHSTLAKLNELNGLGYQAIEVTSVTGQVVSGTLNVYQVKLMKGNTSVQCCVEIWSQPWLESNGTNVKIKVEGDTEEEEYTF